MVSNSKNNVFKKRKITSRITILIIGALYFYFANVLSFNTFEAVTGSYGGIVWMFLNFLPDETAFYWEFAWRIITTLWSTAMLAIAATSIAALFALIAGVLGSKKTELHPIITYIVRFIAMVFRNIPLIAWALILIFSFRQNEFTGFLALFFGTFGFLTRSITEIIDESSEGVLEALRVTGASYFQVVFQGVLPMISSQVVSWVLFMIETNIRDATLVGILTGTGIGFMFNFYFATFRYPRAGFVLVFIILAVISFEMLSNKIRRLII